MGAPRRSQIPAPPPEVPGRLCTPANRTCTFAPVPERRAQRSSSWRSAGPPSNSAESGLAHANFSFLVFPAVVVVGGGCGSRARAAGWASPFMPRCPWWRTLARLACSARRHSAAGDSAQPHKSCLLPPCRDFMNEKTAWPPSCLG